MVRRLHTDQSKLTSSVDRLVLGEKPDEGGVGVKKTLQFADNHGTWWMISGNIEGVMV